MGSIALKIRKLREIHGYPQEYIAFKLGVSQAAYSKKETGRTEISLDSLHQLAALYSVSVTDLITLTVQDLLVQAMSHIPVYKRI